MSSLRRSMLTLSFHVSYSSSGKEVKIPIFSSLFVFAGPRKQETKPVEMNIASGSATFNEYLQMGATLFQDTKTKKYQEKKV